MVQVQTDPHKMPIENAGRALAGAPVAVRAGGDDPHPEAEIRFSRRNSPSRTISRSIRGIASRSIGRSAIRAGRASACISRCRSFASG